MPQLLRNPARFAKTYARSLTLTHHSDIRTQTVTSTCRDIRFSRPPVPRTSVSMSSAAPAPAKSSPKGFKDLEDWQKVRLRSGSRRSAPPQDRASPVSGVSATQILPGSAGLNNWSSGERPRLPRRSGMGSPRLFFVGLCDSEAPAGALLRSSPCSPAMAFDRSSVQCGVLAEGQRAPQRSDAAPRQQPHHAAAAAAYRRSASVTRASSARRRSRCIVQHASVLTGLS